MKRRVVARKPHRAKVNATGRNTVERFVLVPHYMLSAPAWKTMTSNAKALMMDVWRRHNGFNNGEISYAVREAKEIGLSIATTARAFQELVERGFLKIARASAFTVKTRKARTWILTAERYRGSPATKEFMRWPLESKSAKNKSQFHQRNAQFHQRNREHENETKLSPTVSPAALLESKTTASQFHHRNTSNLPGGNRSDARGRSGEARQGVAKPRRPGPGPEPIRDVLDRITSQIRE